MMELATAIMTVVLIALTVTWGIYVIVDWFFRLRVDVDTLRLRLDALEQEKESRRS
jgi:ammonia channel protein AmtB